MRDEEQKPHTRPSLRGELAHGANLADTTGAEQRMVGSAGTAERAGPVVQGPGLPAKEGFVVQASLLNR